MVGDSEVFTASEELQTLPQHRCVVWGLSGDDSAAHLLFWLAQSDAFEREKLRIVFEIRTGRFGLRNWFEQLLRINQRHGSIAGHTGQDLASKPHSTNNRPPKASRPPTAVCPKGRKP